MTVEEAYRNYTETKIVKNDDGRVTHVTPRGHYTRETLEDFKYNLINDDAFNKQWSFGCTRPLTEGEIIEYFYTHIDKNTKWKKLLWGGYERYFYFSEENNMWFEHAGSDVLFGMTQHCPKRKFI